MKRYTSMIKAAALGWMLACSLAQAQMAPADGVRNSLKLDSLNVSYLQWGPDNAPPMLLIPGAGSVSSSWAAVARAFAGEYRVLSFDFPGQGYSDWDPSKQYSVMRHVDSLKQAVRALGLRKLVVIGHSQGGNEAVVYAAEDAEKVVALVAADGGWMAPGSTRAARRAEQAKAGIAPPPPPKTEFANWAELRATMPPGVSAGTPQAELENRYKQLADGRIVPRNDPELAAIAEADGLMQPAATEPFARRVKSPAMVIRGGNDTAFARENAEALAALIPDVRLVVTVPGAGHSLQRDKPEAFVAAVRGFLLMLGPRP